MAPPAAITSEATTVDTPARVAPPMSMVVECRLNERMVVSYTFPQLAELAGSTRMSVSWPPKAAP